MWWVGGSGRGSGRSVRGGRRGAWRCAGFSITYLSGLRLHLNNPQSGINRRIHHGTAAADSDGWLRPLPPFFSVPPPPSPATTLCPGQEMTRTLGRNTCSNWAAGRLRRFCMMERFGARLCSPMYVYLCACVRPSAPCPLVSLSLLHNPSLYVPFTLSKRIFFYLYLADVRASTSHTHTHTHTWNRHGPMAKWRDEV